MRLSPSDLAVLSRLIDEALAVEPSAREAWLLALPPADAAHLPKLRELLAHYVEAADTPTLGNLPSLPPEIEEQLKVGERFGAYRVLELLGQGGMGAVWLAERADGAFDRQVAVKLPRLSGGATASSLLAERMAREQQLLARLEHPHIARLYDAGVDALGRPYLVMERVHGEHLLAHCRHRALKLPQRLELVRQVCAAVAHAHRQLVVHRDIKPSNILVDRAGQVKLLDFGIAKLLDVDGQGAVMSTQGQDSLRAHTPHYAAPEQARGGVVGTASDIYSLGVVLQELVADTSKTALRGDLQAIVRRATATLPEDRYASADHLSDDLQRYLARLPLFGAPPDARHRAGLFLRRNALALGVAAVLAAVVAVLGGVAISQAVVARASEAESRTAQTFLLETLLDLEPAQGQAGNEVTALQILDGAAAKAQRLFEQQPVVLGQVLTHVGIMYSRLGQAEKARTTAEQTVKRLESALPAQHDVLQAARGQWAQRLSEAGLEPELARSLAAQVLGPCGPDAVQCARARAYAHSALWSLASASGNSLAAVQHARSAAAEVERGWLPANTEWVTSLSYLATALRNRGDFVEADAAIQRAVQIAKPLILPARTERELRLYEALIDADMGRMQSAGDRYAALQQSAQDPAERRLLRRLQAQVFYTQGLLSEGLLAVDEALDAGAAPPNPLQEAFARLLRARLAAATGEHAAAAQDLAGGQQTLARLGLPEASVERLRARRAAAELELRAGRVGAAVLALQSLRQSELAAQPALTGVELGQTLDLLGCALRQARDFAAAAQQHTLAAQALQGLPEAHPLRQRNAVYAALARPAPLAAADQAALERAIDHLRLQLPQGSVWLRALQPSAIHDLQKLVL